MKSIFSISASALLCLSLFACGGSASPTASGSQNLDEGSSSDNSCDTAGDCRGFLPRIAYMCADGSEGGAIWTCQANQCVEGSSCDEHGGIGTGSASNNSCESAGDCHGALPRIAYMCQDGSEGGAIWTCQDSECVIGSSCNN